MTEGELILYTTEDGSVEVQLRAEGGTVWLTQMELTVLFDTSKQNISLHIKNILSDGEMEAAATVKESLTVQSEGKRRVTRRTQLYNLEMILAIGYRVQSPRGIQFRQWATAHLREYLVKGFVLDDTRLTEPGGWDYFDELLERIRAIRASEKRFYQKVRDIYATAVDYDPKSGDAQKFFKITQNKMLWAITGHTAAELIADRSDDKKPNMGLTAWRGARVRKHDITVAKNYLNHDEIRSLDRIVVMYLDYAEDQARRRNTMTMREWAAKLDAFLSFNERDVLTHAGKVEAAVAEKLVMERYESFDASRREAARLAADAEDMNALERTGRTLAKKGTGNRR